MATRHFLHCMSLFIVLFWTSCSSDKIEPRDPAGIVDWSAMNEEERVIYARSIGAITIGEFNELVKLALSYPVDDTQISDQVFRTLPIQTIKGYRSYYKLSNIPSKKVYIGDGTAGLPPGVYFASAYMVLQEVKCEAGKLYIVADSPQCGYDPDAINYSTRRGYKGHMSAGYWKMESIAYMIEHDMLGQQINRFYPLLPADFVWNYQAGTLQ